ncbi:shikimate kinase [Merismopedia glauca CCAP 1448/3]|uniref:Shikimate kinase n=2 Tax=Merismopedia TaxID=53402 RepID=A0A2T1C3Q6_9CYAN|nr:shikimate kinase [Merismopedia glauca]PSB02910.1 shikimate kinase [Merismopedia glauca CCAP 1448/3]
MNHHSISDRTSADTLTERLKGINIYLIGMMGVGKSTIGKLLQSHLKYGFCDTDAVIEQVAKKKITDIFNDEGETAFRDLETQVLEEVCAYTRLVIATGGGIVERSKNWSYLHYGLTIWLDAPLETILSRVASDEGDRPLASQIETRLQKRQPLYSQADLKIDATGTPEAIVEMIITSIPQVLKSDV